MAKRYRQPQVLTNTSLLKADVVIPPAGNYSPFIGKTLPLVEVGNKGLLFSGNGTSSCIKTIPKFSGYPYLYVGVVSFNDVTTNNILSTFGIAGGNSHRVQIDVNAGNVRHIVVGSAVITDQVPVSVNKLYTIVAVGRSATDRKLFVNELTASSTASASFSSTFDTIATLCGANATYPTGTQHISAKLYLSAWSNNYVTDQYAKDLVNNPWQIFKPTNQILKSSGVVGPTTHDTSGVLTGTLAEVVGTAARSSTAVTHSTSGVLTGSQGNVVGSARRNTPHSSSGVLTGSLANVVGTSDRQPPGPVSHATSGVLIGDLGTVVGVSSRLTVHSAVGVLLGGTGTVSGVAQLNNPHPTSGVLTGGTGTVSGSASRSGAVVNHATTGALTGDTGTVSGTASFGAMTLTPADIQAIVDAIVAAIIPVNVIEVSDDPVTGIGTDDDPWGPV